MLLCTAAVLYRYLCHVCLGTIPAGALVHFGQRSSACQLLRTRNILAGAPQPADSTPAANAAT